MKPRKERVGKVTERQGKLRNRHGGVKEAKCPSDGKGRDTEAEMGKGLSKR